jgi:hypothetical protein
MEPLMKEARQESVLYGTYNLDNSFSLLIYSRNETELFFESILNELYAFVILQICNIKRPLIKSFHSSMKCQYLKVLPGKRQTLDSV